MSTEDVDAVDGMDGMDILDGAAQPSRYLLDDTSEP